MNKNGEDIWIENGKIVTPVKTVHFEDDELNVEIEDFTVVEVSAID
ncbi:hypothetical protein [Bacillus sp. MZGC1]|nr:hypothetical protein [Bacillus sp. MZGC1]